MTTVTITIDDPNGFDSNLIFPSSAQYYARSAGFDTGAGTADVEFYRFVDGVRDDSVSYELKGIGKDFVLDSYPRDIRGIFTSFTFSSKPSSGGAATQLTHLDFALDGPFLTAGGVFLSSLTSLTADVLVGRIQQLTPASLVIIGNIGNDTLNGSFGDDILRGGRGGDRLIGGFGNDTASYEDSTLAVTVNLATNIVSGGDAAGDTLSSIENIVGSGADDTLTGNALGNFIDGGLGFDVIRGGGGNDAIFGRDGGGTLYGDGGNDRIDGGAQNDTIYGGIGDDELRVGDGTNSAYGEAGEDTLLGASGIDRLYGGADNDQLEGGTGSDIIDGGTGADRMYHGTGAAMFYVDNPGDFAADSVAGDGDRVLTSVSYTLIFGSQIEIFTTTLTAGLDPIALTGNEVVQTIVGNAGANLLDGRGGADTMRGQGGSDLYRVDNVGDVVDESDGGGGGIDTVQSTITFSLVNSARVLGAVENVSLLATGPSLNINATGNALANILWGNAGINILDGLTGADTMRGRGGNDTYRVDNAGDIVDEADGGGGGIDTVQSTITFSLVNSARVLGAVENLSLTGSGAINGTGNALANKIWGGTGNNTLTGGAGADTFVFHTALNAATNVDTITDFALIDTIQLENAVFTALTTLGTLASGAFFIGAAAHDGDDRIIYNSTTGALSYDFNGNVAGGGVKFAQLSAGLALTNADFFVI